MRTKIVSNYKKDYLITFERKETYIYSEWEEEVESEETIRLLGSTVEFKDGVMYGLKQIYRDKVDCMEI